MTCVNCWDTHAEAPWPQHLSYFLVIYLCTAERLASVGTSVRELNELSPIKDLEGRQEAHSKCQLPVKTQSRPLENVEVGGTALVGTASGADWEHDNLPPSHRTNQVPKERICTLLLIFLKRFFIPILYYKKTSIFVFLEKRIQHCILACKIVLLFLLGKKIIPTACLP